MQYNWEKYIERLVREYSNFLLIATVLLSATVGFLAIPSIPELASVAAIVSVLASLGSITVGVFSIWRHQANTTTTDSFAYIVFLEFMATPCCLAFLQHSSFGLSSLSALRLSCMLCNTLTRLEHGAKYLPGCCWASSSCFLWQSS
ncbi:hypothetical protein CPB83DRAFT_843800 [Crepidotus variabilis]|uniref:Uncharacterized protein n=1 Tax=Crepidotus variabilis TaxID=179855 RepID=A0A9P6JV55_9AGAR|nr:hypothetical protein CPB83DRAFT_843800 [Crepidotus variabilis]